MNDQQVYRIVGLTSATAGAAFMWLWRYRRRAITSRRQQRLAEGHCLVCGYDLRYARQRCPECGAVLDPATRYRSLVRFFGVYFWQKWQDDAPTDALILEQALEQEPERLPRIFPDLANFLEQGYSEEEIRHTLRHTFGCHYIPTDHGQRAADWLQGIHARLSKGLSDWIEKEPVWPSQ